MKKEGRKKKDEKRRMEKRRMTKEGQKKQDGKRRMKNEGWRKKDGKRRMKKRRMKKDSHGTAFALEARAAPPTDPSLERHPCRFLHCWILGSPNDLFPLPPLLTFLFAGVLSVNLIVSLTLAPAGLPFCVSGIVGALCDRFVQPSLFSSVRKFGSRSSFPFPGSASFYLTMRNVKIRKRKESKMGGIYGDGRVLAKIESNRQIYQDG